MGSIIVAAQLPDKAAEEDPAPRRQPTDGAGPVRGQPNEERFWQHPIFHRSTRPQRLPGGRSRSTRQRTTGRTRLLRAAPRTNLYFEAHALSPQALMSHFVSFVAHGVCGNYPTLKLLLMREGRPGSRHFSGDWTPSTKGCAVRDSWVHRLPSEYFRDHVCGLERSHSSRDAAAGASD